MGESDEREYNTVVLAALLHDVGKEESIKTADIGGANRL